MFDFAWSEIALIGAVALVVIGPKDLPVAIRAVSGGIKKARRMAGEFQSHLDEMVREADLGDVRDLKNLNVRGSLMKVLDSDGSLARAVAPPAPLVDYPLPAGPRALDAAPPIASTPWVDSVASYEDETSNVSEAEVQAAPLELPPGIVRRILNERDRLNPPAILPPVRVVHGQRAVAPGRLPGAGHDPAA
ncbi:Sec-independent protein translocase protein TatB [Acetobacter vaccinii]|uniref:Twin-arginine translocase subunit TatB n=1 Tax=Acetobacter vaccinii TaxID=2592655 RepID=A0A5C1YN33_9PROT|nr:Sec-independent protein translocase protein TatB [Acetobacter vaccinii]QEO17361.1 twin-arginine translocase subunit TatB [Acetobacter vaccinii]